MKVLIERMFYETYYSFVLFGNETHYIDNNNSKTENCL